MLTRKELEGMTVAQIRQICRIEPRKFKGDSYYTRKADLISWMLYQEDPGSLFLESVKSIAEEEGWTVSQTGEGQFDVVMNSPAVDFADEALAGESLARTEIEESPVGSGKLAEKEAIVSENTPKMGATPSPTVERFIKAKSLNDFLNLDSETTDKEKLSDSGPQLHRGLINQNLAGPSEKCPWCENCGCPTDGICTVCDGNLEIDGPKKMRWELAEFIPLVYTPVVDKSKKLLCLAADINPEIPIWTTDRYSAAFLFPGTCSNEWMECVV